MLETWLFFAMSAWVPMSPDLSDHYAAIATDIAEVAHEAPLYDGEDGIAKTALLMASIASFESFYRKDVDSLKVKGDNGAALCIMQVHPRPGEDLSDRKSCLRVALMRMHESFSMCRSLPLEDRLSAYTRGTCAKDKSSEYRVSRAVRYWKAHPYVSGVD